MLAFFSSMQFVQHGIGYSPELEPDKESEMATSRLEVNTMLSVSKILFGDCTF